MLMWGWGQTAGLLDRRSPGLVKASPSPRSPSIIAQSVAFSFPSFFPLPPPSSKNQVHNA